VPLIEYAKCDVCNKVGQRCAAQGRMNLIKYFAEGDADIRQKKFRLPLSVGWYEGY
jgi:hypothetical protein